MKLKSTLIPALTLIAGVGAYSWFAGSGQDYTPRAGEFNYQAAYSGKGISGALAWTKLVKANQITGEISLEDVLAAEAQVRVLAQSKAGALNLQWVEQGPANVGGRTRAFLIDTIHNKFYAGGVAGGLWYSTDRASTWNKVNDTAISLFVSCITQAANGDVYYGTGEGFPTGGGIAQNSGGTIGRGIFKSTDGTTFSPLPSTMPTNGNSTGSEWAYVTKIIAHPTNAQRIYAGTSRGLRVTNDGGTTWASDYIKLGTIIPTAKVDDIELGSDGSVVVSMANKVYHSPNGDHQTFDEVSPSGMGSLSRLELATAPSNPNVIYAAGAAGGIGGNYGVLAGVWLTEDKGATWTKIGSRIAGTFEPFTSASGQGYYDNIAYVHPDNAGEFYLGGVGLYRWKKVNFSPVSGSWEKIAFEFPDDPSNPFYVHADKHEIKAERSNTANIFVTTDGGVFQSTNRGITYTAKNRNYNVTQFYSVGFSGTGEIVGGTQDNGTQYVDPAKNLDAIEVTGGDGGYCEISNINSDIIFSSIYYGALYRSEDRGNNVSQFYSPGLDTVVSTVGASFVTPIRLWESFNDPLSLDSVWYFNTSGDTITAGSAITIQSTSAKHPFQYTTGQTLLPGDSILVRDPVQAQLALGLAGQIWLCINPLNTQEAPVWVKIATFPGVAQPIRFTRDGNTMFFGTQGGVIYRVTGLSSLTRADETPHSASPVSSKVTMTQIGAFGGRAVNDIDMDPNNPDNAVVVLGNYGNTIYIHRATNAYSTSGTANWVQKQGVGGTALPRMPIYSVVIDKSDPKKVILGTEYGIYSTTDITAANPQWADENNGVFPNVPAYMVRQQILDNNWDNNVSNSGCIYVGTHGRGFWKSCTLGSPDVGIKDKVSTPDHFRVYPNPASSFTNMDVILPQGQTLAVKIYDLTGKVVKVQNFGKKEEGAQKLQVNTSGISTGTYIISVEGDSFRKATRLSIVK